ncbi:MAG: hypothetical protein JNL82_37420 [Myxococcales bacterium]|nr:hypothetical protein [Myxococcales bacterium]
MSSARGELVVSLGGAATAPGRRGHVGRRVAADVGVGDHDHTLRELHLWRQPADGARTLVATFNRLRKAKAALRRCEAAANSEPHRLEGR